MDMYNTCQQCYNDVLDLLTIACKTTTMKTVEKVDTVYFSVKGQVVIPSRLRKEYEIEEGTRALVHGTDEGILIKPVTSSSINRLRGILKRKPGGKSFAAEWAEHKADEESLEDAKYVRIAGP